MRVCPDERIDQTVFSRRYSFSFYCFAPRFASGADGRFNEIADDLLHVPPDIADLGEFGGLNFQEGRIGKLCQTPRHFGFSNTGWPDHQDILWRYLIADGRVCLFTAPAIAQGDGHSALGLCLANNMAIKFGDNLARG